MASLQFTIIDYTTSTTGITTIVEEPVGLDTGYIELRRDENYHGFLGASDGSFANLQFYGDGYTILTSAYENHGIDAYLLFTIGYQCGDDGGYSQIYSGRFSFDAFKVVTGIDGCYCEIAIESGDDVLDFRNRIGQKVSLDSRTAFDDIDPRTGLPYTELSAYTGLDQTVLLNPMKVRMTDYATVVTSGLGSTLYTQPSDSSGNAITGALPLFASNNSDSDGQDNPQNNEFNLYDSYKHCILPYCNITAQEFGDFPGPVGDQYNGAYMRDITDANPIFTFRPDIPYLSNAVNIDMELSIAIFNGDADSPSGMSPDVCVYLMKGITWNDAHEHRNFLCNGGLKTSTAGTDYGTAAMDLSGTVNAGLPGGIDTFNPPSSITDYNIDSLGGCSIFIDERYNTGPIMNDFNVLPPTVGVLPLQFSFHSRVWFNPGEQLFLFIQIDSHRTDSLHYNPQTVIYSGNYTYRNSYNLATSAYSSNNLYVIPANNSPTQNWVSVSKIVSSGSQALSYIKLTFDSLYKPTECSTYMVSEALSRASEIITDGALPVYSDYFGRTDAQPYPSSVDGPGGLECITNGLLIRGYSPLVAFYMGIGQFHLNGQSVSSYTLMAVDGSTPTIVSMTGAGDNTVLVPPDTGISGVPFVIGTQIIVQHSSPTGSVSVETLDPTLTTIISPTGSFKTSGLGSQMLLTKIADDTWLLGAKASMYVSFQEMMDALSCIHAVGFGMENDPHRAGEHLIRVEPISYFYQDTVLLTCENVDTIECNTDPKNNIGTFKCGYAKWEAEEAQGLDEFLTRRTFRTTLSTLRAGWDKLCKFVASGYAIETTRRKLGTTTTDWRYDKDNFIMCLQRALIPDPNTSATIGGIEINSSNQITGISVLAGGQYTSTPTVTITPAGPGIGSGATAVAVMGTGAYAGQVVSITVTNPGSGYTQTPFVSIEPNYIQGYEIEQGSNAYNNPTGTATITGDITSATGMIDATTVYNYRISPIRNALRWLRYVLSSYVNQWATGQLIFTEGDGNYYASGIQATDPIEAGVLHESSTLTLADYADSTIKPIYKNELIKFKYPMGYADWQTISATPYGLVQYNVNNGPWQYGWIQEIKYDLYGGIGEFTLKPKI